jgi:hypothetical protein
MSSMKGKNMSGGAWRLGIGAATGYCSSRLMDQATSWYRHHQSEASRRREEELAPGGAGTLIGKKLGDIVGHDVTDEEAAKIGLFAHRSLGVAWGVAAAALVRAGIRPMPAGLIAGAAAFLVVDEGANAAFFTPPPQAYPIESHLRGVVGHLAYGVSVGAMLSMAQWFGARRP